MTGVLHDFEKPRHQAQVIADLRTKLAERFSEETPKATGVFPVGLAGIDAAEGGLRQSALSEVSGSSGIATLFLHSLLRTLKDGRGFAALVDAARTFEPEDAPSTVLERLLIISCQDVKQAIRCADLLARDGNLSLIILDLHGLPARQLGSISANVWHRFQRLAEQTTATFVILTPQAMVEAAHVRISGQGDFSLTAQRRWRHDLIEEAVWQVFPRRAARTFSAETQRAKTGA